MRAVSAHAGAEAVEPVAAKVRCMATHGSEEYQPDSRLVLGAQFLARFAHTHPLAAEALQEVDANWDRLLPPERQALAQGVPLFAERG